MTDSALHLAFGPVQEFVAQARRARDLWIGSYLLSYLSASALSQLDVDKIILPAIGGNPLVEAVRNHGTPTASARRIGSVPHIAEVKPGSAGPRESARAALDGWTTAWVKVSGAVRTHIEPRMPGFSRSTAHIWETQTREVWRAVWIYGEGADVSRRKSLRDFSFSSEGGEKCTCCGVRDALRGDDPTRHGVRAFWAAAANRLSPMDIRPDGRERLCAICTIKRFLPRVGPSALGWALDSGFPSTATFATLPWREGVLRAGSNSAEVRTAVRSAVDALGATGNGPLAEETFSGLSEIANSWPDLDRDAARRFLRYDGDWFYLETSREDELLSPIPEEEKRLIRPALQRLVSAARQANVPPPSNSYALLAMDGDQLGALLRAHATEKSKVSRALQEFSAQVQGIVEGKGANGRLIYAGGDDVLAMLPRTTALRVARQVRTAYGLAFAKHLPGAPATISAGLVFAHVHASLQRVVQTAHRILDENAKEQAGRDAMAVAVWKRSGIDIQFATKWDTGIGDDLDNLVGGIKGRDYSPSFLLSLDKLLASTSLLSDTDQDALLAVEYMKSRERRPDRALADERVKLLRRLLASARGATDSLHLAVYLTSEEA